MEENGIESGKKSTINRILYKIRDFRSKALFSALRKHCNGNVLDVGGWDFYQIVKQKQFAHQKWTTLENNPDRLLKIQDSRFNMVHGDGCDIKFPANSFDTVVNVQVLEHVFEPIKMVQEIGRVLKPGGHAIFLIPQTSNLHLLPHHYYNFTSFWIKEAMKRTNLEIIEIKALGGAWSTIASRLFYFILQSLGSKDTTYEKKRFTPGFFLLYPLMLLYIAFSIPICMLFGLKDMEEEPNNHLVVVRKPIT